MISKNKIRQIKSLESKKGRDIQGFFVAEGPKVVGDILAKHHTKARIIIAIEGWFKNEGFKTDLSQCETIIVNEEELAKVSFQKHPQQVLAVFEKIDIKDDSVDYNNALTIVLDGVQDPGNLGTIVRIADWFGIGNIICSPNTADIYNPKVVQATMGSIARVNVKYMSLDTFFDSLHPSTPVYGTLLEGKNMYETKLTNNGIIIMGNEGKGISHNIRQRITNAIRIPNYPEQRDTADSLNVAIATAIVCAEFRKNK